MKPPENLKNPKNLNIIFITAIILSAVMLFCFYGYHIGTGISKNPDDWSSFGAFFGGTIGPIVSFFAFIALLITIQIQSRQLEQSQNFHEEQAKLLAKQNFEQSFFTLVKNIKDERKIFNIAPYLQISGSSIIEETGHQRPAETIGLNAFYFLSDICNSKILGAKNESEAKQILEELLFNNPFMNGAVIHNEKILAIFIYILKNYEDDKEIKFYLNMLIDFLSLPEIVIFSYICLIEPDLELVRIIKKHSLLARFPPNIETMPVLHEMHKKYFT